MKPLLFFLLISVGLTGHAQTADEWCKKAQQTESARLKIEYANKALALNPNKAWAYFLRAQGQYRFEDGIMGYSEAIRLNPKYEDAYIYRALLKMVLRQYREAILDYDEAIKLDPSKATTYLSRGLSKYYLDFYQESILDFDKAIKLNSKFALAYIHKGNCLFKLGRHKEALHFFSRGEALDEAIVFHFQAKESAQKALKQQTEPQKPGGLPKRYALVIGNDRYLYSTRLGGQPINDAQDVAEKLKKMGFTVILSTDANRQKMLDDLDDFVVKAQRSDVVMIYYSSHGVQNDYENYLVPIDARFVTKSDIANRGISVGGIIGKLGTARAKFNIIAMDACRSSTITIETSNTKDDIPKGFKPIKNDDLIESVYISLASRAGMPAYVNTNGRNGYFTTAVLKHMQNGKRIESIFRAVSVEVGKMTGQKQQPEIIDRLSEDLEF